jgi:DNA processing protein
LSKLSLEQIVNLKLLLSIEGIGPVKLRSLLSKFKSIENILNANYKSLVEAEGINQVLAKKIFNAKSENLTSENDTIKELAKLEKVGGKIITIWDKEYPELLKKIYDPPIILYCLGNYLEENCHSIAVVGTRQPTNYGKIQAEKITGELALQNITIVSGLARGIDSIAHHTALKNSCKTIAVLGSGLDVIYPPENKKLFYDITENGLIVTEYPLGTKPDAMNFPKRNRIISGLSLGTVIIETAIKGGAIQTASFALDQNREVFALPGNIGVRQSEGTNILIRDGRAKLITCAEDVLNELELKLKPAVGKNIPKPQIDLNIFEAKIYDSLSNVPLQIDQISTITNLSTSDCLVYLLSLEFRGLIKQIPGKMFILV